MPLPYGKTETITCTEAAIARGNGYRLPVVIAPSPRSVINNAGVTSLENGASFNIRVTQDLVNVLTLRILTSDAGGMDYEVFSDPTFSAAGMPLKTPNMNGLSSKTSATTFAHVTASQVTNVGQIMDVDVASLGGNPASPRSPYSSLDYKTLEPGEYLIRITNRSGQAMNYVGLLLKWWEAEPAQFS